MKLILLLAIVLTANCAGPPALVVVVPAARDRYAIPRAAHNTDLICAETAPGFVVDYCMTVREFRILVVTVRATP